jgi:DNA polymerase-3 subunit delta'
VSVLPWQTALADSVAARIDTGGLPHALLIAGPAGWGELAFGNWLALKLLGLDAERDAAGLAHPDLRWLSPEGAVIKVDAVREVVAFAQGTPQAGPRKVAVIADAHALNRNAANALLKTLEEPPGETHLLLLSSHPGRLLPTIRSRCQSLEIRPDPAAARRWLAQRADGAELEQLLFEYGGAPVAVMTALHNGERPLSGLLERALDPALDAEVVPALLEAGLSGALGRWYRYVCALAAGETVLRRPAAAPRALMAFADELVWARRLLLTSNSANERLVAERLLACWRRLEHSAS